MDVYTIAVREANEAHEVAEAPEDAYDAYQETLQATLKRGTKAKGIVASGGVHQDGREGRYYVESQSGDGQYAVDAYAGTCECPDHQKRGTYCKHLQAAEIVAARDIDCDPMAPDYEALGREPLPMTAAADSRDAAGMPSGRRITTGYTYRRHLSREEACEYADVMRDAWL